MKEQADLSTARATPGWAARGTAVRDALQTTARTHQTSIQSFLSQRSASYRPFWIVNALRVRTDQATATELSQRPDVAAVKPDRVYAIPPVQRSTAQPRVDGLEWGIANIRAGEAWDAFGSRGEEIVVANVDTGVQFDHPALQRQYRGTGEGGVFDHNYNWFDPSSICASPSIAPCDNAGHGTHTMGTMVGDDGDNQIGVAPNARWIAAKGCEDFGCSEEALLASAEWILAPTDLNGENPRPDLRPNIVNNSWGGIPGDTFYQAAVQAWVAAGIFPVFSSGNSGPACGSAGSPGDYPESFAVAAYDVNNEIASFSGRGPGALDASKPNIAAPGVAVRSSVPGNGYDVYDGTSMAAPHIAGTIAVLWSAAPALVGDIEGTRAILSAGAVDTPDPTCGGEDGNNNTWGEGRVDTYVTVEIAPRGPTGTLVGTVTAAGGAPLPDATIVASAEGQRDRSSRTDEAGAYSVRLSVGTYGVQARAFGYRTATAAGIAISEAAETRRDFALEAAPRFAVSGTVRDDSGAALAGATLTVVGTPLPVVTTDASGHYEIPDVPEGSYDLKVGGSRCFAGQTLPLVVAAAVTLDATLPKRFDKYGYGCAPVASDYVAATDPLITTGDDESVLFTLPFPFRYYGQVYESVYVNVNGLLHFNQELGVPFTNESIPSPFAPNAAIYGFWDDLILDGTGSILTAVVGAAPNRQVVIEWRELADYEGPEHHNFEIVLNETGEITFQYGASDTVVPVGASATIGIEDQTGSDGLLYSFNEPSLSSGAAVRFSLPPSGIVKGIVTDANDGLPLVNIEVVARLDDAVVRTARTNDEGRYSLQVPVGSYVIAAAPERYTPKQHAVTVAENGEVDASFALESATVAVTPAAIELVVPKGESRVRTLTLENAGTSPLVWSLSEAGGAKQALTATAPASTASLSAGSGNAASAANSRASTGSLPRVVGWATESAGDVLASFTPTGVQQAWGVGFDGNVWFSDAVGFTNTEFGPDGTPTGRTWPAPWATFFPGDMAYDAARSLLCQLNVGGDNGIYCWDPATGTVSQTIVGSFAWTAIPQRGLAYDPADDSFYIGGWDDGVIYHVAGLSHPTPGELISSCAPPDPNTSGLAWNASMGVLWQATNSDTDSIFELNAGDCTVLSTLPHPEPGFNGGGAELDASGNLWIISQITNTAYLIESGVPSFSDVPWITTTPESGTLAPGATQELQVEIDATDLEPGAYLGSLYINSNAGRTPSLRIPISLVVTGYQRAIDSGSSAYTDAAGEVWAADQAYVSGGWGYVNSSISWTTEHAITGTLDPALYQTVRVDPFGYRFDAVPNGVYQVELRFAQLRDFEPGERQFDVIIEDTVVLPAYDPAYRSGDFAADDHTFYVPVTDGQLDVRFATRVGRPIISALRITHRPDR